MGRGKWCALFAAIAASALALPGVAGAGVASPSTLDFGSVPVNTSKTLTSTLTLDAGYHFGGFSGDGLDAPFQVDAGGCTIGAVGSCQFSETYTPTTLGGSPEQLDLLECVSTGPTKCQAIVVSLLGSGVSVAAADPGSLDFGSVPINTSKTLQATVTLDAGYHVGSVSGDGGLDAPFQFDAGSCTSGAVGSCQFSETFSPTTSGAASGEIDLSECPAGDGSQCLPVTFATHEIRVGLQGSGVSVAAADPGTLQFGSVPVNTSKTLQVKVTLDAGYQLGSVSNLKSLVGFNFDIGSCTLGAVGSCEFSEMFSPTALGVVDDEIDPSECPIVGGGQCIDIPVVLKGRGVSVAAADPGTLDFGSVPVNTSKTLQVKVTLDAGYQLGSVSNLKSLVGFYFESGSCTLGAVGSCEFSEVFTPSALGVVGDKVDPSECPISGGQCIDIPVVLQGSGVSVAAADPGSLDFGSVPINTSKTLTSTLTIDAGYYFEGAGGTSGLNPPFHFDAGSCNGTTTVGSCRFSETFTPTAFAAASGEVDPDECPIAGGDCIDIPVVLQGSGVSVAAADPGSLDFGSVPINTSKTLTRTVTVTLDAGYRFGAGAIPLGTSFHFDSGSCNGPTDGVGSCEISVTFTPTAFGAASGEVDPDECPIAGGDCINIPVVLQGSGVSVAAADPGSLDFGSVPINTSKTLTRTVTVTLDAGYRFGAGAIPLGTPFHFDSGSCNGPTDGVGSCQISVTFTPTAFGAASGEVDPDECPIAGGDCINIPVVLQGSGVSVAAADPGSLDFGSVPINTSKTLTSTVTLDAGYQLGIVIVKGGVNSSFQFAAGSCTSGTVGSCQVSVTFTPTALGAASGEVDLSECPIGGGDCIDIPVVLQGSGVSVAAADPGSLDFGSVPVNTSKTLTSTVTLDAGYHLAGASDSGVPFRSDPGSCTSGTVGSCQVSVTFTPTSFGAASGELDLSECPDSGGSQCIAIPVGLQGSGVLDPTTSSLSSSASPSFVGQSVTFTATLGGTSTAYPATGTVTFTDGSATLGTVSVSNGSASLTVSSLSAGTHSISAAYSGDGTYAPSSGTVVQTVELFTSETKLDSAPNPSIASLPVTLTASVAGAGPNAPTGVVTFTLGAVTLGSAPVVDGYATLVTTDLPAGSDQVAATYSGDAMYAASTAMHTQVVRAIATVTSLASSSGSSAAGAAVTFTASVRGRVDRRRTHGESADAPITGTVTFSDGTTVLGTSPVVDGKATFTISSLAAGRHVITASYSGDSVYAPSDDSRRHSVRRAKKTHRARSFGSRNSIVVLRRARTRR